MVRIIAPLLIALACLNGPADAACTDWPNDGLSSRTIGIDLASPTALLHLDDCIWVCDYEAWDQIAIKTFSRGDDPLQIDAERLPVEVYRTAALPGCVAMAAGTGLGVVAVAGDGALAPDILIETPGTCHDVAALADRYAVIADWSSVRIFDLQDPAAPVEVGAMAVSQVWRVTTQGDLVLAAGGDQGLLVISAADPAHPSLLTALAIPGSARDVAVEGKVAALTTQPPTVTTVDIADPAAPYRLGSVPCDGTPLDLALRDGHAYVHIDRGESWPPVPPYAVQLVAAPAAGAPVDLGTYLDRYQRGFLTVDDVGVTTWYGTFPNVVVTDPQCPRPVDAPPPPTATAALGAPFPNPFNPRTTLEARLPEGARGTLAVHDLTGRRVALLDLPAAPDGARLISWDGRMTDGRAAPSGPYVFRLLDEAGRVLDRRRGVLVR